MEATRGHSHAEVFQNLWRHLDLSPKNLSYFLLPLARSLCTLAYINFYAATDPNIKWSKYFMSLPLARIFALTGAPGVPMSVFSLKQSLLRFIFLSSVTYSHTSSCFFSAVQTICEDHEVIVFFWSISPNLDGNIGIVRKQH